MLPFKWKKIISLFAYIIFFSFICIVLHATTFQTYVIMYPCIRIYSACIYIYAEIEGNKKKSNIYPITHFEQYLKYIFHFIMEKISYDERRFFLFFFFVTKTERVEMKEEILQSSHVIRSHIQFFFFSSFLHSFIHSFIPFVLYA